MEFFGFFAAPLMIFAVYFIILWVFRGPVLWYFRINEKIENQQKQLELLGSIYYELKKARTGNAEMSADTVEAAADAVMAAMGEGKGATPEADSSKTV
ncbi:MAG: hypothetical protein EOO99_00350 [Pedobacter sp.]|nr:MAG: hypothetical protein EOO99_00350 [Pedobacter sp.]